MNTENFLNALFCSEEGVCIGDFKAKHVSSDKNRIGQFFCINPLALDHDKFLNKETNEIEIRQKPRRADLNVTKYKSFLFEIDNIDLESQLHIFDNCKIEFTSIVYSGGKSYHAILSLEQPLEVNARTIEGVSFYKRTWERIAAYIDSKAVELGVELPEGAQGFVDRACKNPSRLSRLPGAIRSNGNLQELIHFGSKISNDAFADLLEDCPVIEGKKFFIPAGSVVENVDSAIEFWQYAPSGLANELRYVPWASDSNCYPDLYRVACWAIDATGIEYDLLVEVLWQRTFPKLIDYGYPKSKLLTGIKHAYESKRRSV